jgi:S1-C subfamily serine protease
MLLAKPRPRSPRNLRVSSVLVLAAILAAPAGAQQQRDLLTLRGPGSQIGATFRNVQATSSASPDGGAMVVEVQPKGPAATAGIRAGDLVTEFDGIEVRNSRGLIQLIGETPPGRTVSVTVMRDGRARFFKVAPTLGRLLD